MKQEFICVGRVVNAHGIRGEVRVQPRNVAPAFLTRFSTFYMDGQALQPTANHVHKSMVLMKFPGVEDMNAALSYKGRELFIRREDAPLPQGQYFDDELMGLDVYDAGSGRCLGQVVKVEDYPAHKVYTVRGERTYLIPAVPEVFIQSVDLDAGCMDVRILEGMANDEH